MIIECVEIALRNGCDLSLSDVTNSQRFKELSEKQDSVFDRYSEDTDQGIALRAGHLVMGQLFNTMPEDEALRRASTFECEYGHGTDLRSLITCLGERLVRSAKDCLSPNIMELAEQWNKVDSDGQIDIIKQLYFILRSENQEARGNISMDTVMTRLREKMHEVDDSRAILPGLYGKWDPDECPANCQGKTQMLVAFARLVGAEAMVVSPIKHASHIGDSLFDFVVKTIEQDLKERGLEYSGGEMREGFHAYALKRSIDTDSFHCAVAIRIDDERWVLIDPHGLSWGVFPEGWNLEEKYAMLEKYGEVLPGIQLHAHDNGFSDQFCTDQISQISDSIRRSRDMEELIRSRNVETLIDFVDILADSDDLAFLFSMNAELEGESPPCLSSPEVRRYLAMVIAFGGEDEIFRMSFSSFSDTDFCQKQIKSWLSFYHVTALNNLSHSSNLGELIHPVSEFGLPEYHIAMSAINSLGQDMDCGGSSPLNKFYIEYGFDQVMLHNALSEVRLGGDTALAQVAGKVLKALPFVHPLSKWRLDRLGLT